MSIVNLKEGDFDKEVIDCDIPVLVDFWAVWCTPCKMISPFIDEIAKEYEGKIKVCKANVDETSPEVMEKYPVFSVPTILIFNKGKIVESHTGACAKESIEAMFTDLI